MTITFSSTYLFFITKPHPNVIARSNSAPAGLISLIMLFFGISFLPTKRDQKSAKSGLGDVSDSDKSHSVGLGPRGRKEMSSILADQ